VVSAYIQSVTFEVAVYSVDFNFIFTFVTHLVAP
jgi:hypothetical protein